MSHLVEKSEPSKLPLLMTEIKVRKGEPIEKAIRRLKKRLDREQTLYQFRMRRRFEKPSARRRRKEKAARFAAMRMWL